MRTAVLLGFGRNDVRTVRQEPLLAMLAILPLILLVVVRLAAGPLAAWLLDVQGFDLAPHEPLLVGFLLVLIAPMMIGVLAGLLILDERDQHVLAALQVTPLALGGYTAYRLAVTALISAVALLATVPASGLVPLERMSALVPSLVLAGMLAPVPALLLAAFAGNKVEGLAVMKALNMPLVLPVVTWFARGPWEVPLALVPTYWPLRAFWEAQGGGTSWPYVLGGFVYLAVVIAWLLRRFQRRVRGG